MPDQERRYLAWLEQLLTDPLRLRQAQSQLARDVAAFAREYASAIKPRTGAAIWTLVRTLGAMAGGAISAWQCLEYGWWWAAIPLVVVSGLAGFGGTAILHDTVHGSFFPDKRANAVLGRWLAPVYGFDFATFKRSHMAHHRESQSLTRDPKYPKLPWPREVMHREETARRAGSPLLQLLLRPVAAWFRAARRVQRWPLVARDLFYRATILALGGPTTLLFGGEVALFGRDFRRRDPWISLAQTIALYGLLAWISPTLLLVAIAAIWIALGCFFLVFLTHLSPNQVYMADRNHAVRLLSLNVSDIRVGPLLSAFGLKFTEHHAAHHLMPAVPCYRLTIIGRWVEEAYGAWKAPTLALGTAAHATYLGDAIIDSIGKPRDQAWPKWMTAIGPFIHRDSRRDIVSAT